MILTLVCRSEDGCVHLFCSLSRTLVLPVLVLVLFPSCSSPMSSSSLHTMGISENSGMPHLGICITVSLFSFPKSFSSPNIQSVLVSPQTSFHDLYSSALASSLCNGVLLPSLCTPEHRFFAHSPISFLSMTMATAWTYGTPYCS